MICAFVGVLIKLLTKVRSVVSHLDN